jgi:hypothetical protein
VPLQGGDSAARRFEAKVATRALSIGRVFILVLRERLINFVAVFLASVCATKRKSKRVESKERVYVRSSNQDKVRFLYLRLHSRRRLTRKWQPFVTVRRYPLAAACG